MFTWSSNSPLFTGIMHVIFGPTHLTNLEVISFTGHFDRVNGTYEHAAS